jgi:hypothetical protein
MSAPPVDTAAVAEINRLHAEVQRGAAQSREVLTTALSAAWQAGQLLRAEHERIGATMLRGAWSLWIRKNFRGSAKTAKRYMALAEAVADPGDFPNLSLRQVYFRLGIATEPKKRRQHPVSPLPDYVRLAGRLVCALRRLRRTAQSAAVEAYRCDLRPLYEQLQPLFGEVNQTRARASNIP